MPAPTGDSDRVRTSTPRAPKCRTSRATSGRRSTPSASGLGGLDALAGVVRDERDAVVAARRQRAVRAQADRRVDRLRAIVKEIERPDVVRAAREIDPRRRGGVDAHARIIMAGECRFGSFGATPAAWPSSDSPATAFPTISAGSSPSSISAASSTSPATSSSPRRSPSCRARWPALARDWPFWISVDQEGGRVARLKSPFTEWPPAMTLGRSGDEALAARFAAALAAELRGRRHQPRLRAGARRPHESGESGHRRSRARRAGRADVARLGARDHSRRCRRPASPPAASTFPATATRASTRTRRCRSSSTIARRLDAVELVPFRARDRRRRRDHHDRARARAGARRAIAPASFSPRIVTELLKTDAGLRRRRHQRRPRHEGGQRDDAAARGDGRGHRRRLRRRAALQLARPTSRWRRIEALIRAAESGALPQTRIDDALARQQRGRRSASCAQRPRPPPPLDVVGCARASGRRRRRWRRGGDAAHGGRPRQVPAGPARAAASRSSRRPARSIARSSRPASPSCGGSASSPSSTTRSSTREAIVGRAAARARAGAAARVSTRLDVDAIIAVRGGYGSVETAAAARRRSRFARSRTAFVGYSDVTSLHSVSRRRTSASRRCTAR